jgi:serine/threonine protein kinase
MPLPSGALESGVQIGDFRIERRLGAGGMGIVYQARQLSLNRPVALKVLGQALTRSTDVSRFQREAQAAARLKHPAIAQVYFIGQDRHLCYLAMELVDGVSLRRALDRLGEAVSAESSFDSVVRDDLAQEAEAQVVRFDVPTEATGQGVPARGKDAAASAGEVNPYLSPQARELRTSAAYVRRACEVIRDAAKALAHAHEQGVIHRDIKPDNLLLDRKGGVHLIDFGVARFFEDQAVTYTGQLVGTPLYMSPEQVTGRGAIDARTDVYSLGLVLYELLALRPPIEATNRENLLRTIVTKPLAPICWRNEAVPAELQKIVHRATQKDPDQRYASAAEFAADMERFLAGKPVTAPPYSFRLDEREIVAARPGRVVLAAFIYFVTSFCWFIGIGGISLFIGVMFLGSQLAGNQAVVSGVMMGVASFVLVGGIGIGWGLLAGRAWARWLGVVVAALVTVGLIWAAGWGVASAMNFNAGGWSEFEKAVERSAKEQADRVKKKGGESAELPFQPRNFIYASYAMYALPVGLGVLLGAIALWALLSRVTGQWFRFAREVRMEHRRLRKQLAG